MSIVKAGAMARTRSFHPMKKSHLVLQSTSQRWFLSIPGFNMRYNALHKNDALPVLPSAICFSNASFLAKTSFSKDEKEQ